MYYAKYEHSTYCTWIQNWCVLYVNVRLVHIAHERKISVYCIWMKYRSILHRTEICSSCTLNKDWCILHMNNGWVHIAQNSNGCVLDIKEGLVWFAHEWNINVLKEISNNVYCSWKKDRCVLNKIYTGAYCTWMKNWCELSEDLELSGKNANNMRTFYFIWCFIFWLEILHLFFVPVLRKKREKDVNLKWGLVCGLEAPITWPYSWKFSPSLLQILGWKSFVASSLSIHGPSFFGTTKYHGAIDFSKNEFSLGIFFMT